MAFRKRKAGAYEDGKSKSAETVRELKSRVLKSRKENGVLFI
jgi:hypothetical protein